MTSFSYLSRHFYWGARTVLAWGLAIATFALFALAAPHFFGFGNLYALIQIFGALAPVAAGLGVVMLAGEFDLSIVGVFPLAGITVIALADTYGLSVSFALALAMGVGFGLVNGWAVGVLRIPSIAVTVATMMLSTGLGYLMSHNNYVAMKDFSVSLALTQPIAKVLSWQSLTEFLSVVITAAAVKMTRWGRYLYAVGGDSRKARASGLPAVKTLVLAFVISSVLATLTGALQGIALASATPGSNDDCLLQAATAALIGGVSLSGGRGSLVGAVGGAFLLSIISSGLNIAGISSSTIELVNGAILAAVVACDLPLARFVRRRAEAMQTDDRLKQVERASTARHTPPDELALAEESYTRGEDR